MMKRKIRLSALIAVMVLMLALLIGGLYGTFSDTEESTGNVFTAGSLNLLSEIDGANYSAIAQTADGINDNITFAGLLPNDAGSVTWTLTNDGTVDGTLSLVCTDNFSENGVNEPEQESGDTVGDGTGELDETIYFQLYIDTVEQTSGPEQLAGLATYLNDSTTLAAGQTMVYELTWTIGDEGNEIQSDSARFDITFTLAQ